jgi:alkanesulfonate monooxygenase SsuD/methylene tetrahydromethanopterin reductase-like flavin-dependent oxidoreductase (luciferase family)
MDEQIAELRRIWSGQPPADGGEKVLPLPVQVGGPPIHCSAQGPKGIRRAARWAVGYGGFISERCSNPEQTREHLKSEAKRVRDAWREAGRKEDPYLTVGCFYGLGNGARKRLAAAGGGYRKNRNADVTGGEFWVHDSDAVREVVSAVKESGFHHMFFIPTNDDVGELDELSAILQDSSSR